jgi:hypothetical protein
MPIIRRYCVQSLAVTLMLLAGAGKASAQTVIVEPVGPPTVTYYQPAPVVAYSLTPIVTRTPTVAYYTPRVAYAPIQTVSYYPTRVVSYYPAAVSTTRYGLFGQPRETRLYYPAYVLPR